MSLPAIEQEIAGAYQLDALLSGWPLQRAWHRARLDFVAQVLPPVRESLSLDVAAGSGILTWRFRHSRIVSVDARVDACRVIRGHTPGAPAVTAEIAKLPFRAASFSRIYLLEILEHLTPQEGRGVLEEVRRVARPGTRCLISTPNYRSHWVLLEWMLDTLRLTPALANAQHVTRYDSLSLAGLVESSGWQLVRLGSFNLVAPFVGMVSRTGAARTVAFEAARAATAGALLYAVCEAPGP